MQWEGIIQGLGDHLRILPTEHNKRLQSTKVNDMLKLATKSYENPEE